MKASLKIFAFAGSIALAAAAAAACTVTTSGGDTDGGTLFGDAGGGSDSGQTGNDSGQQADTGGNTGCTALTEVDPDGGSFGITFDQDGGTACDTCIEQNCCTQFNGCFQDGTGDCQELNSCLEACVETPDAGGCETDCQSLHTPASSTAFNGFTSCVSSHCASSCP